MPSSPNRHLRPLLSLLSRVKSKGPLLQRNNTHAESRLLPVALCQLYLEKQRTTDNR